MSWTINSVAQAAPGTVSPITVSYAGVAGRLYALALSRSSATDPFTTVTDNAGNTWVRRDWAPKTGTAGRRIEIWTCVPTAGFATITVAFTGTGIAYATLVEIRGQTGVVNAVAADFRASSAAPAALNITPTVADTLAIAACQANPNTVAQMTPSAGWTSLATNPAGPALVYRINPPAGTPVGVTWTFASAAGSGHGIIAFEMDPAGPPVGPTVTVWDGTTEKPAAIEGVWNGSTVVPMSSVELT